MIHPCTFTRRTQRHTHKTHALNRPSYGALTVNVIEGERRVGKFQAIGRALDPFDAGYVHVRSRFEAEQNAFRPVARHVFCAHHQNRKDAVLEARRGGVVVGFAVMRHLRCPKQDNEVFDRCPRGWNGVVDRRSRACC